METVQKVRPPYYVKADTDYTDDRVRILNYADTFAVFDRWGDIQPVGQHAQGLYHEGTRFVSSMFLKLFDRQPFLLNSSITEKNEVLNVDLTNHDIYHDEKVLMAHGKVHIQRRKFLQSGICYERVKLTNYSKFDIDLKLSFSVGADFKDIFEVRGYHRSDFGSAHQGRTEKAGEMIFIYEGLDGIKRVTEACFEPEPDEAEKSQVNYYIHIDSKQSFNIYNSIKCTVGDKVVKNPGFNKAYSLIEPELNRAKEGIAQIHSSNEHFNHWLNRSETDLIALTADTPHGKYPYAGVPWFNTPFGRDGILTAYMVLWAAPDVARGVLSYLAHRQATENDDFQDSEPGKILHETRGGEMAELREVPYKLYYGTIDATPLFIVLAGAYYERTGDLNFIKELWPNIEAALKWIDEYGDMDGDGFVEYYQKSQNGLINQGWKDADNAISHEDGRFAEPPIALCEVQAYVYDAKKKASQLAKILDKREMSQRLDQEAETLKKKFNATFWDEELGTFVMALDKDKNPCRVKSSNAGQCLFSKIAYEKYASRIAESMLSNEMFSGWGIRTLGKKERRYNPMSYHNGSIWPHDNALIAHGLSKYGYHDKVLRILEELFDATLFIDLQRLPELFCGFDKRKGEGPTRYPVACSPQAWAVAVVYMLLQSSLRLDINALEKKIYLTKPVLPEFISSLEIKNLKTGDEQATLRFQKYLSDVGITVVEKGKGWEVIVVK